MTYKSCFILAPPVGSYLSKSGCHAGAESLCGAGTADLATLHGSLATG